MFRLPNLSEPFCLAYDGDVLLLVAVSPPSPLHGLLVGVLSFSPGFLINVSSICLITALPFVSKFCFACYQCMCSACHSAGISAYYRETTYVVFAVVPRKGSVAHINLVLLRHVDRLIF